MNLCDVNVWLAVALSKHVHHRAALRWLDGVDQRGALIFCRATQQALLRLLTNPAVLGAYGNAPLTNAAAWRIYESFTADDRVALRAGEPPQLEKQWKRFAVRETASPKLWMDAYLAAFAVTAGLRLVTTDTAFQQFAGLDLLVLS